LRSNSLRRRRKCFGRQQGREFRVGNNFHCENRLPALDFIAVGEHRFGDARAIQKRAVAALAILHSAAARPALHGKVHAGHERVVRQSKLRAPSRPPNGDTLARLQADNFPRHRPRINFENYSQTVLASKDTLVGLAEI
jgi:hypothetical protein